MRKPPTSFAQRCLASRCLRRPPLKDPLSADSSVIIVFREQRYVSERNIRPKLELGSIIWVVGKKS